MSINLDEIERAVSCVSAGPWRAEETYIVAPARGGRPSGEVIGSWRTTDFERHRAVDNVSALVLLRNSADELLRLARIGQATEAEGKGEGR